MGCAASKGGFGFGGKGVAREPRDPDDLELDPVDMLETLIPAFDEFFSTASDPLNELVDMNNTINDTINKVKDAVAKILNAYFVEVRIAKDVDSVRLDVSKKGGAAVMPSDIEEALKKESKELLAADAGLAEATKNLELALEGDEQAIKLAVSPDGTLTATPQDGKVNEAVKKYNELVEEFKKQLQKAGDFCVTLKVEPGDAKSTQKAKVSLVKQDNVEKDEPNMIPVTVLDVLKTKNPVEIFDTISNVEGRARDLAAKLNDENFKDDAIQVDQGRLLVPKYSGKELSLKKGLRDTILNFNVSLFKLAKRAMIVNGEVGLVEAVKEVIANIKEEAIKTMKATAENSIKESISIKPKVDVKGDGSFDFSIAFSFDPSVEPEPFKPDMLPKKARVAWEAIMEVQGAIGKLFEGVPALKEKLEALVEEAKGLSQKLKDEATNAGLGLTEALTATKNTAENVKNLASGPNIINIGMATCKRVLDELERAVTVAAA